MATWMVHFRIAESLLNQGLGASAHEFLVGNIGPDCGLPDPETRVFIPPKQLTHFHVEGRINPGAFAQQYLNHAELDARDPRDSFLLGYYVHLLTDVAWSKLLQEKKHEPAYVAILGKPGYEAAVKRDWYGADYRYLKENTDNIFTNTFQHIEQFPDYLDFFPANQVSVQIRRISEFYNGSTLAFVLDPAYRFQYFSPEEADRFVEETAEELMEHLRTQLG